MVIETTGPVEVPQVATPQKIYKEEINESATAQANSVSRWVESTHFAPDCLTKLNGRASGGGILAPITCTQSLAASPEPWLRTDARISS